MHKHWHFCCGFDFGASLVFPDSNFSAGFVCSQKITAGKEWVEGGTSLFAVGLFSSTGQKLSPRGSIFVRMQKLEWSLFRTCLPSNDYLLQRRVLIFKISSSIFHHQLFDPSFHPRRRPASLLYFVRHRVLRSPQILFYNNGAGKSHKMCLSRFHSKAQAFVLFPGSRFCDSFCFFSKMSIFLTI